MLFVPKLDASRPTVDKSVAQYLNGRAEFHLNSYSDSELTNVLLIADAQHLNEIVLHAPFGKHALEIVCMSDALYAEAEKLVRVLSDWEKKLSRSVTLLYHVSLPVDSLIHLSVLEKFIHLLDISSIKFLLENSYANLSAGKKRMQEDPILYVLEGVSDNRVSMCFDLCHHMASRYVLKEEYSFNEGWSMYITQVHFSDTKNCEGYIHSDMTHGRAHTNMWEVARDLCQLRAYGIDLSKAAIVTEISEGDYLLRPEQVRELRMLYQAEKSLHIV